MAFTENDFCGAVKAVNELNKQCNDYLKELSRRRRERHDSIAVIRDLISVIQDKECPAVKIAQNHIKILL